MRVCAHCGQENLEVAKFCLACGESLAAPTPPVEERKLVTVLFTDIVGSTAKAEQLDPEDVRARLAPYYARLRTELVSFGGTVEKFIGDAVVALFGAPVAHEDDPERAVRAALAIRAGIDELNREDEWLDLQVRIGVNTGEALVVVGAKASEGEGMASGDVMNTAARLQSAAPVNGILVGELTYQATRETIEYRAAEPIAAKGKTEPVRVWEVEGLVAAPSQRERPKTPLVGREEELGALIQAWEDVLHDRQAGLVTVLGAAGVGKTRLLDEFAARVEEGGSIHWGRCLSYGEGITYWAVTELVKSAAGIFQSDAREAIAEKLDVFLDRLPTDDLDELRTIAAALSNLLGIPTTPRGTYTAREISRGELHWGIRRALQLLSLERPLALVFEDLHWAEPTLLELIDYLAAEPGAPLLLVGSARPELAESKPAFVSGSRRSISLEPLQPEQGVELLAQLLGDSQLASTALGQALIKNANGNPLFLEETVRMLRDDGLLEVESWQDGAGVQALAVPASLQALISSRIDGLEAPEKQLAHHASIVGAVFWTGALAHLGADNGRAVDIDGGLATLARRDFVQRNEPSSVAGDDEYGFKHILIRDVAYGQVPKGKRVVLHVRFSDWLTALPGSADEFVEIVAWHLEQACRLSREVARSPIEPPVLAAAEALANAAGRAERRDGLREARRYFDRALELLGEEHRELRLELRLRRATILTALGELRQACEELVDIEAEGRGLARDDLRCAALIELGDIDQRQGRASDARRKLAEAQSLASQIRDRCLELKASLVLATLKYDFDGDFESAISDLRAALVIADEVGDSGLRSEGQLRLSILLMNLGRFADAESELTSCIASARELGSHKVEAEATAWLGGVKYYVGDREEGRRLGLQACEWLERTGDSYYFAQNLVWLAAYGLLEADPIRAEQQLQLALPVALEIGGWLLIQTYRYLIEALLQQGRVEDARELVSFASRSVPAEDSYARAELLRAEAIVAVASGEAMTASTALSEALRLLEELRLPVELGETRVALARALQAFGDLTGARAAFQLARSAFTQMGLRTFVDAIDGELAQLEGGAG